MTIQIKVGDIMTRSFISVKPETSLIECAKEMIKNRVGSLLLVKDKTLKGIITEKDIVWALTKSKQNLGKIKASEISPKKIATIKPSATLEQAIQRMKKMKFRKLPVTVNGSVIGMLTLKDILRIEPSLFEISNIEKIREETEKLKRITTSFSQGVCEECGNFNSLYKIDNRLLCDLCREGM